MSYSRWSNSFWYTFWSDSRAKSKEEEIFEICDFGHGMKFNYAQIKENPEKCMTEVKEYFAKDIEGQILSRAYRKNGRLELEYENKIYKGMNVSSYLPELQTYMTQFLEDVENYYKKKDSGSKA